MDASNVILIYFYQEFNMNWIHFFKNISVPESEIGKLAKKVSMDKKDFVEETKKALTQMDMGNLTFEYKVW